MSSGRSRRRARRPPRPPRRSPGGRTRAPRAPGAARTRAPYSRLRSAAAPAGEPRERAAAELRADVRHRLELARTACANEDPLVGRRPRDEQPAPVGRPGGAAERAGAGEEALRL